MLLRDLAGTILQKGLNLLELLISNFSNITWQSAVMWVIGGILIYLAIKKEMEPTLLLPIGFGAILMNFPGVITYVDTCVNCNNQRNII